VNMTLEQRIHNTHVNNWELSVMHWLSALAVYISLQLIELLTVDLILKKCRLVEETVLKGLTV